MLIGGEFDPATIPVSEQLKEVEKEIEYRWRVYKRQVQNGRMSSKQMYKRIAIMIAVRDGLRCRVEPKEGMLF